ncbi:tRNA (adenosine(37)-N6)-threonylcarbamoyltransferase complex dimerization subunit type 1 TsaB [Flavobacterium sp. UBA7682]|uniref:tRNA (adenosine(37)-N6)-threonylcarbamoyltransferase complex dimerization subunit type 1 TsaB n=1 Tax=Flavobacterium sp. UBA7682 TaxID=1946560 RepID=UPI0025C6D9CF|nr:tRNA (adenosine(37)-N6)-threonylcarbamoyltransferase complex dimerization subunit type 1 TsaB [Flavobacterium sp. UBA7682]
MTYILNLETSTKNCSVSVAKNGEVLILKEIAEQGYSHAEKLHVFIQEVVAEANITLQDLSAIAVGKGPGSYTGLRIGVSTAKGLSYALGIPLLAVDTLLVLAKKVDVSKGLIVPMLDARRMEVYNTIYTSQFELVRPVQAEVITEDSFQEYPEEIYLVGDGALKCQSLLCDARFHFLPEIQYPSAQEMAALSFESYKISDTVDVAYFEPFYLKDFVLGGKN